MCRVGAWTSAGMEYLKLFLFGSEGPDSEYLLFSWGKMPATHQLCVNADYFSLIKVNRQPCSPEYEVPFLMQNSRRKIKPKIPQQEGQCRVVMRSRETCIWVCKWPWSHQFIPTPCRAQFLWAVWSPRQESPGLPKGSWFAGRQKEKWGSCRR